MLLIEHFKLLRITDMAVMFVGLAFTPLISTVRPRVAATSRRVNKFTVMVAEGLSRECQWYGHWAARGIYS